MSFQYIHTSAKRGLEPGKSGFCCVARDRSLPPDLIAELESQSRYSVDSQGTPPLILRHRIVTLRSGTYHILSRIQESGTDYSKRNNHIAHHLAFSQDDFPGLPNPAAILLNWRGWRDKWVEPPRILEPFETFYLQDVESFWSTPSLPDSFKNISHNGQLISRIFKLSIHEERLLIEHLRRSLNDLPTPQHWQHTFTSCLLPTDQPHDYSWAGYLPSLPLPYELPTENIPLLAPPAEPEPPPEPPKPSQKKTTNPSSKDTIAEQGETTSEAPSPAKQKKFAAPVVEIPKEYDHRKRKRPKRRYGQREFTRAINIAIAGSAVICIALIVFFVQTHRSKNLDHYTLPSPSDTTRALQARQNVWKQFADAGYPRAELENARATAQFLAKAGEDAPLQSIAFLERLLDTTSDQPNLYIPVPKPLIQSQGTTYELPLSTVSYPALTRLALLPQAVAAQLDFPPLEQTLAPLSTLPAATFSLEAFSQSLDAYLLLADTPYDNLPQATRQAMQSYFAQVRELQDNSQFAPFLDFPESIGLGSESAYIAINSDGLLIPGAPMSLSQYLRELFSSLVQSSKDQALQSTAFQTALANLQSNTRSTPSETANQISAALAELPLQNRSPEDPLRKLRAQWQYTFTHPDLMEQTIIGYNLEALEAAKLRLAETRSQFSQADLALHLASRERAQHAAALKATAKEAVSSKDWIVISKQSTKVPNSLP
ncbi:hypothetical protein QEH56_17065 [Pelagicoccus enzymogenes]|uniref:GAP1-N2 domain-containing protein n=1 Tax=Pelagicoccus enzymogenes TaxID=2773457 RepID=UPI00280F5A6E|nr:hypothetical protein [Pelagicoccus enzymogenes]MDQ8199876.1 hypothetical protein [Pelagicoccus enzymogenes]